MMFYSTENAFEIFLLAQLLCEGDVALTLYKMTKPKGLNSAVNPYVGFSLTSSDAFMSVESASSSYIIIFLF